MTFNIKLVEQPIAEKNSDLISSIEYAMKSGATINLSEVAISEITDIEFLEAMVPLMFADNKVVILADIDAKQKIHELMPYYSYVYNLKRLMDDSNPHAGYMDLLDANLSIASDITRIQKDYNVDLTGMIANQNSFLAQFVSGVLSLYVAVRVPAINRKKYIEEAKEYFRQSIELSSDPKMSKQIAAYIATLRKQQPLVYVSLIKDLEKLQRSFAEPMILSLLYKPWAYIKLPFTIIARRLRSLVG